jgi:ubiquinone biosynthesis protein Coq4
MSPKQFVKTFYYAMDWAWNPTHTASGIIAISGFMNQKNSFPKIDKILSNPALKAQFESQEFKDDLTNEWNLDTFLQQFSQGSLGFEYATFMKKLGFTSLKVQLSDKIPTHIQNHIKLAFKNHDLVHLLYKLYDENPTKIRDYHEWIFLFILFGQSEKQNMWLANLLFLPSRIKAILQGRGREFEMARTEGMRLSKSHLDLNHFWFKPYFYKPIDQVRQELGILV